MKHLIPLLLLSLKRAKHPWDPVSNSLPLAWTLRMGGARAFYTALGHTKEH